MNKLDLSDRESIAIGIVRKQPLSRIGNILNRSTSSISREIKKHRIFVAVIMPAMIAKTQNIAQKDIYVGS